MTSDAWLPKFVNNCRKFVRQHVLKNCQCSLVQRTIALNLMPAFAQLSTQKFSSNVVELCFSVSRFLHSFQPRFSNACFMLHLHTW